MSKFVSLAGVVFSVSDDKDHRYADLKAPDEAPRSESPDSTWKVADLKSYAEENGVDLGDATKKADIIAAINAGSDS